MTKVNSTARTRTRKPRKPDKPHKDFPLFAHNNGQWAKKVRGKIHFFGVWSDDQKALERWLDEKDDLLAGRVPRARLKIDHDVPTLEDLATKFLTTKGLRRDRGDLSPYTWNSYSEVCDQLLEQFGKDRLLTDIRREDFEQLAAKWAKAWGPVRLGAEINRARVVFNFAWNEGLIAAPIKFGDGFKRPSKKVMRLNRAKQGKKMFEADELRKMIDAAAQPLKAMILLGVNAGLGNSDVGRLPMNAIDLESGWLNYPRPKTGIMRRCPLWPETIVALREAIDQRPRPKDRADEDLVFLTFRGNGWTADLKARPLTNETAKLLDRLAIDGRRNFYALRHTFETVAGECRDQVAVDAVMGHDDGSMASAYREGISDERLRAATDTVRKWLFEKPPKTDAKPRLKIAGEEELASA